MITLRDYQQENIQQIRHEFRQGHKGVAYVLPTGGGKTICFSEITRLAVERGNNVAVTAHRRELLWQCSEKMDLLRVPHGIIQGRYNTYPDGPVQLCSIDSMANRELVHDPDLIIIDEAHLINSDRYKKFIARYPKALRLLVTATLERLDGKGFDEFASSIVYGPSVSDLIGMGHLVSPRVYTTPMRPNLCNIKIVRGGDYSQGDLQTVVNTKELVGDIVEHYTRLAWGKKAIVFCAGVDHSKHVAHEFNTAGFVAEHIDGTTTEMDRKAILQRFKIGITRVLCNANVLCEGYDEPSIEVVILARPTMSSALYIQQAGRGLRPYENKTECIILDHAGNTDRHGLVTDERFYTLEAKPKKKYIDELEKEKEPIKEAFCKQCFKKFEYRLNAKKICTHCFYDNSVTCITEIEVIDENLIEITDEQAQRSAIKSKYLHYLNIGKYKKRTDGKPYHKSWAFMQMIKVDKVPFDTLVSVLGESQVPYRLRQVLNDPEALQEILKPASSW